MRSTRIFLYAIGISPVSRLETSHLHFPGPSSYSSRPLTGSIGKATFLISLVLTIPVPDGFCRPVSRFPSLPDLWQVSSASSVGAQLEQPTVTLHMPPCSVTLGSDMRFDLIHVPRIYPTLDHIDYLICRLHRCR